jgi:hypothetical protein
LTLFFFLLPNPLTLNLSSSVFMHASSSRVF